MSDYNSTDKTSAITVTKIVSPGVLPPVTTPTEIPLDAKNEVVVLSVSLLALDSILMSKMKVSVTGMNHGRIVSLSSLFSSSQDYVFSVLFLTFDLALV